jgi:hypothetical protein
MNHACSVFFDPTHKTELYCLVLMYAATILFAIVGSPETSKCHTIVLF